MLETERFKYKYMYGFRMVEQNSIKTDDHYIFFDRIKSHDGLYRLTVPKQLVEGTGWEAGDKVKVWIRKVVEEEEANNEQQ
jgi:hypothetical protein